jgi:hypothetical protein
MLNRTNRTLSANLNRLNLGTRSLGLQASAIVGGQTLRIRHAHDVVMRDGIVGVPMDPITCGSWRVVEIPCSSPVPPRAPAARVVRDRVEPAAAVRPATAEPAFLFGRPGLGGYSQRQSQARLPQEPAKTGRKPLRGKRPSSWSGVACTADRAALRAYAASPAAAGG